MAEDVKIDTFFAPNSAVVDEVETEEVAEQEVEESEETEDESGEHGEDVDTSYEDEDSDEDDEDDEPEAKSNLESKAEAAERQRREMQAERDLIKHQNQLLTDRLERLDNEVSIIKNNSLIGEDDGLGDYDDLVTAKVLREREIKRQVQNVIPQQTAAAKQRQINWINSQNDMNDVISYYRKPEIQNSAELAGMDTNETGQYLYVRAKKLEADKLKLQKELAAAQKQMKKLKRKGKGPVPKTGAIGSFAAPRGPGKLNAIDNFFR